jgi:hypothetical protein
MTTKTFEDLVSEALLEMRLDIENPFTASQCGYQGLEGYCRRKRLLNHFKPENIEEDEDLQKVLIKGYFTELAYKQIVRDIHKERVYTKVTWNFNLNGIPIRVDPDIWIPALQKIIEIKAVKKIPEKPFEHHRIQVGIQILACPKLAKGEIHYIEWEGRKWNMKVYNVEPLKQEEIDKIIEENKIVKEYWDNKQIPPIPDGFQMYKYPCFLSRNTRCPHWDDCWLVEKSATEILIDDIDVYYKVTQKVKQVRNALERLEEYKKKLEQFLPKEQGLYRCGDYELKVNVIPETIIPAYKREAYIRYTIKRRQK